jgi:sugar phosphate isomerase/epimerase
MSTEYSRYNDGSRNAPRLRVQHSFWSLIKLPLNAGFDGVMEWTLDEKFARVKAAGFEAVECWLSDDNEKEITEALKRHELRLVMGHRPFSVDDTRSTVERAARVGADFLFMQPASAYTPLDTVAEIVRAGRQIAADNGLACFVEVHRNNWTETIPQTLQLIERVPEIRFTADLSHFVVVGEFYGWKEEGALEKMLPILERTSHAHARIGNGEQVQVDVGDGSGETAQFFVRLWAEAMRHWKKSAGPGDVFPFTSELGPPRYAITLPDGREFSDRWEQSLVMKKLAEQAWEQA